MHIPGNPHILQLVYAITTTRLILSTVIFVCYRCRYLILTFFFFFFFFFFFGSYQPRDFTFPSCYGHGSVEVIAIDFPSLFTFLIVLNYLVAKPACSIQLHGRQRSPFLTVYIVHTCVNAPGVLCTHKNSSFYEATRTLRRTDESRMIEIWVNSALLPPTQLLYIQALYFNQNVCLRQEGQATVSRKELNL